MTSVKRNARGKATRQELLDATVRLVQRFGYDKTSISRVMKETGTSTSSIYWMFGSKDGLITEALDYSYPQRALVEEWDAFDKTRPVLEQLSDILALELVANKRANAVRTGVMLALEGSAEDLPVQRPFRGRRKAGQDLFVRWWTEVLQEMFSAGELDIDTAACRMGKLTMWFIDGHFVGDRDVRDVDHENRARVMATALVAAAKSEYARAPKFTPKYASPLEAPSPDDAGEYLLYVTRKLVGKYGYEGASVARICDATGLSRSSLYWRYKDKDALVQAAITDRYLDLKGRLESLPQGVEPAEVLGRELTGMIRRVEEMPNTAKAGVLMAVQRWDPPIPGGVALVQGSRLSERRMAAWLESGAAPYMAGTGDAMRVAWLFNRLRIGIITGHVLGDNRMVATPEMAVDAIREFGKLLRGEGQIP